jgi:hypothetical protein
MSNIYGGKKKTIKDIEEFGWHVINVLEDDKGPGFGYSIGLFKTFGHPEILIVGLKRDLMHSIINNIGESIRKGTIFTPQTFHSNLIVGFDCYFTEVKPEFYEQYVGQALWYYENSNFPLIQCIYPTVKGIYPWQEAWPETITDIQPILGEIKLNQ